jgi:hypothetical protein
MWQLIAEIVQIEEVNKGYAVGWGALSLVNAGLAQSKNRSGFVWWVISLLLGPIATFILVAFCEKLPESSNRPRPG